MCSSYRSNKNPQTVKLSTLSSVNQLAPTSLRARYVSVLTPMRPNRPHIPSTIQFSKSVDTKQSDNPNFGLICRRASRYSFGSFRRLPKLPQSAAPRLRRAASRLVFGEALSRTHRQKEQEEKDRFVALFSHLPIYPQFPGVGATFIKMHLALPQDCYRCWCVIRRCLILCRFQVGNRLSGPLRQMRTARSRTRIAA